MAMVRASAPLPQTWDGDGIAVVAGGRQAADREQARVYRVGLGAGGKVGDGPRECPVAPDLGR